MEDIQKMIEVFERELLTTDRVAVRKTVAELSAHFDAREIPDKIILPALERIGQQWETGQVALSQVYMSGTICEELIDTLLVDETGDPARDAKVAIVTFKDHHLLGKRIVLSLLKSARIPMLDFGHGLQADALVNRVEKEGVRVLLISTLMLPSALHIKQVREQLTARKLDVKIIVGGAPFRFDEQLWKNVGADAMGHTATDAVTITQKMLEDIS